MVQECLQSFIAHKSSCGHFYDEMIIEYRCLFDRPAHESLCKFCRGLEATRAFLYEFVDVLFFAYAKYKQVHFCPKKIKIHYSGVKNTDFEHLIHVLLCQIGDDMNFSSQGY